MGVWILSAGTLGEGLDVKDLYATKAGARTDFLVLVSRLRWEPKSLESLDNDSWAEDDHCRIEINDGCDFVELVWRQIKS